ncbi:MAG: DUF1722 domain-containing protein [Xanthomonadaceae bacterium]|nr:DUF1722 domain-containing protein [Xanthomonadaceae bacterium]
MMQAPDPDPRRADAPLVGVSSCLCGEAVRYDGRDKRDDVVADVLPRFVRLLPLCPEVAIGLGVPRPPIRLEGEPGAVRVVGVVERSLDVTERLEAFGRETAARHPNLCGYVFKSKSPSCGLRNVKRYAKGQEYQDGSGLYAAAIRRAFPLLPVAEEGDLATESSREDFLTAVFAYHRWQALLSLGPTPRLLQDFHAAHKLVLLARSRVHLDRLGQLAAAAAVPTLAETVRQYGELLMQALALPSTRERHADALQHLQGFLKQRLDGRSRAELAAAIDDYRRGLVPRTVPLTLLRQHCERHPHAYVQRQVYLHQPFEY